MYLQCKLTFKYVVAPPLKFCLISHSINTDHTIDPISETNKTETNKKAQLI